MKGAVSGAVNVGEEGKGGDSRAERRKRVNARQDKADMGKQKQKDVDAQSRNVEAVSVTHPCVVQPVVVSVGLVLRERQRDVEGDAMCVSRRREKDK